MSSKDMRALLTKIKYHSPVSQFILSTDKLNCMQTLSKVTHGFLQPVASILTKQWAETLCEQKVENRLNKLLSRRLPFSLAAKSRSKSSR